MGERPELGQPRLSDMRIASPYIPDEDTPAYYAALLSELTWRVVSDTVVYGLNNPGLLNGSQKAM